MNATGFSDVLSITLPIFLIISLGYVAVKVKLLTREGVKALAAFAINFAVPALLFKTVSERSLNEVLHVDYLFAYGLGSLITFVTMLVVAKQVLVYDLTRSSMYALGSSLSNSLMIGFPIVFLLLGSAGLVPFALSLLVENFLILTLALLLADIGLRRGHSPFKAFIQILKTLSLNPLILAIAAGLLVSVFSVKLPAFATTSIDLLARTLTGVGLFAIGGMLVGFQLAGNLRDVNFVLLGKLLLHPIAVFVVFQLYGNFSLDMQIAAIVFASAPMFGMFPVIATRYGLGPICAATQVATTLVAFISMTLITWLLTVQFQSA